MRILQGKTGDRKANCRLIPSIKIRTNHLVFFFLYFEIDLISFIPVFDFNKKR